MDVFGGVLRWTELACKRFPVLGAYELALEVLACFLIALDARGAISVTERVGVMAQDSDVTVVGVKQSALILRREELARRVLSRRRVAAG